MRHALLLGLATVLFLAVAESASAQAVRVLYYSGSVTVGGDAVRIGQQLKKTDKVKIGSGGSVQFSVNGKVLKYSSAATVNVADVIKRAGTGENSVVANSARTLAGASGAGRSSRTSVAGATRADGKKETRFFDSLQTDALNTGSMRINGQLSGLTGIDDPFGLIGKAVATQATEPIIILQPRSTAVAGSDVLFRWRPSADITRYLVTVRNWLGEDIHSTETTDSSYLWKGPALVPNATYTWRVADAANPKNAYMATFNLLPVEEQAAFDEGLASLNEELGADNPALPLMLGTYYADNECYGQAAQAFTDGALSTPEHAGTFWELACEQYLYNMFMPVEEGYIICAGE